MTLILREGMTSKLAEPIRKAPRSDFSLLERERRNIGEYRKLIDRSRSLVAKIDFCKENLRGEKDTEASALQTELQGKKTVLLELAGSIEQRAKDAVSGFTPSGAEFLSDKSVIEIRRKIQSLSSEVDAIEQKLHQFTEDKVRSLGFQSFKEYQQYRVALQKRNFQQIHDKNDELKKRRKIDYEQGGKFFEFGVLRQFLEKLAKKVYSLDNSDLTQDEQRLKSSLLLFIESRMPPATSDTSPEPGTELSPRRMALIAGAPASGKSTYFEKSTYKDIPGLVVIDPDLFNDAGGEWLKENFDEVARILNFSATQKDLVLNQFITSFSPYVTAVHEISVTMSRRLQALALQRGLPFVDLGTMINTDRYINLIKMAVDKKYQIDLVYCHVKEPAELLSRLVRKRARAFPPEEILETYKGMLTMVTIRQVLEDLKKKSGKVPQNLLVNAQKVEHVTCIDCSAPVKYNDSTPQSRGARREKKQLQEVGKVLERRPVRSRTSVDGGI